MIKLTKRQSDVLDMIRDFIDANGFPPTRAEIAAHLGFKSPNAAEEHLKALVKKNAIEILSGASRGIRVLQAPHQTTPMQANNTTPDAMTGIPVIGKVAAGHPVLAQENIANHVQVAADFFSPKADYLLSVIGMSMKDIGIMEGDLIAVHKTNTVKNGQIVVARIDEEVTVKRFQQENNIVRLIAENDEFDDILVDLNNTEFAIEGLSVGVIRQGI